MCYDCYSCRLRATKVIVVATKAVIAKGVG